MNIFSIPPGVPFLDALAQWWLAQRPGPLAQADGLILLPTRRAARALADAFLRAADGRPLLLPRIAAIGAIDEVPLALAGALDIPPAASEPERLAALTRLILGLKGRFGAPVTADRAWPLAAELARLLDEAHREAVDLAQVLPGLVEERYAAHWTDTLRFLQIVTVHWPQWLEAAGKTDAAAHGVRLLQAQAAAWEADPPGFPVVIAGTAGGNAATANLMRVAAGLPQGRVVLPGLDLSMPAATWDALDDSHPQASLRALVTRMGATRADVQPWPEPAAPPHAAPRADLLWQALLPANALAAWRRPAAPDPSGLERLEAADQQEEAVAIALALRGAIAAPGAQAALVTPDRALAARVGAELARFGIVVDDSAGEPLAESPPGTYLRLLLQAATSGLAPVALLALLKHPLAALGLPPVECRRRARLLETRCLRGPAPPPGLSGLRDALPPIDHPARADLADLLDRLEARLAPLLRLAAAPPAAPGPEPALAMRAAIEAAEACAETDRQPGPERLWALEEGDALAQRLAALLDALPLIPPQPLATIPGLLAASLEGAVVRTRRALRGRDDDEHPRIAILGLLESRLQSFDALVLGGLAETVWPPASDPGPWMSRPMRRAAGLASPEAAVGQMAHDFAMLAAAAPRVILSCPRRRDGAPTVPARWLVRLEAYLAGQGGALPQSPCAAWARQLDQPPGEPVPVRPPSPRPPVQARPRRLSVTEIETWLRDPYGIYAKHILRLRALDELEQSAENADFGDLVHRAIADWLSALPETYPADAARRLRGRMDQELRDRPLRPALSAWWRPRLGRIADWVAETERARRQASPNVVTAVEAAGAWTVPGQGAPFTLTGRADRIERRPDGRLAILDYKTGAVPGLADIGAGYASQLPLEAAMAEAGAFGPHVAGPAAELAYWRLTGGFTPGQEHPLFKSDPEAVAAEAAQARASLVALVARFDDPAQPYLSQPHPSAAPRFTAYAQLARVAEWSAAEDDQ